MVDLGLYNFIKKSLAEGKSREEINTTLVYQRGWKQEYIDNAFADVLSSKIPDKTFSEPTVLRTKSYSKHIKIGIIALLVISGYTFYTSFISSKPNIKQTEAALIEYLKLNISPNCSSDTKEMTVTHLSDISIGGYIKQFDSYPIYASYSVTCKTDVGSYTYDGLDSANKKTAVVFARKALGRILLFVPPVFKDMQKTI